jgi:hypothetical protein
MSKEFHEIVPGLDDWHIFGPYLSFGVVPIRQPADTAKKTVLASEASNTDGLQVSVS